VIWRLILGQEGVSMLDAWLNTGMAPPFEMAPTTAPVTAAFTAPGQASGSQQPDMEVTGCDPATGAIAIPYAPACDAVGHTIHYGNLANVSTYRWDGCGVRLRCLRNRGIHSQSARGREHLLGDRRSQPRLRRELRRGQRREADTGARIRRHRIDGAG